MSRPDDGLIHAWLDGELDAVDSERVAKLVETDAEWGAAAAEARGLIAASARIVKALDVVPAGVIPSGSKAGGTPPRRTVVRPWLRIAATIALVAGVGYVATPSRVSDVFDQDGPSESEVASGDEAERTSVVQTAAPASPPPVSPAIAPRTRDGGVGAGAGGVGATAASRARRAEASEEQVREAPLTLRQDAVAPSTALGRSAVTAAAPPAESGAITPPPAAAPTVASVGERTAGAAAAAEQAKSTARAPAPTAQLMPRQIIDREAPAPSALAASDAMIERVLPGCWRTRTAAPSDSILVDPRILSVAGDSIVIVLSSASLDIRSLNRELLPRAIVVRVGTSALMGTARNATGAVVPFTATRTSCP